MYVKIAITMKYIEIISLFLTLITVSDVRYEILKKAIRAKIVIKAVNA